MQDSYPIKLYAYDKLGKGYQLDKVIEDAYQSFDGSFSRLEIRKTVKEVHESMNQQNGKYERVRG
ncbi:hypothetical protein [Flectobacillus sp. BAB-3569]|uniref:hypothetical protein n=1 Tax=Flectobacillus sp. BAB-3569 TaxID=1509483 RepID=UPI000BA41D8E|nr:hypothetical protein [Flectobacillus sp. BAB-3569]PAC27834.1 hypothetical protein BWI92_21725 [Flectobacillus sp. BAB-3569]